MTTRVAVTVDNLLAVAPQLGGKSGLHGRPLAPRISSKVTVGFTTHSDADRAAQRSCIPA